MWSATPSLVVCLSCAWAAVSDLQRFQVRNSVTFPLLLSGLAFRWVDAGPPGLELSLLGVLSGVLLLLWPYLRGAIGGGDLKLLAAVGAWTGPHHLFEVALATGVLVGCYSAVVLMKRGDLGKTVCNCFRRETKRRMETEDGTAPASVRSEIQKPDRRKRLVPVAAMMAIAVAVIAVMRWPL